MERVQSLIAVLAAMLLTSCGVGKLAQESKNIEPPPVYRTKCVDTSHDSRPLVIHWNESERTDLEAALRQKKIAVVSWTCDEKGGRMRVLRDCALEGSYAYTGVQTKERVEKLVDEDEIAANMPAGGLAFAAKVGADLSAGASLDIGMITVGQNRTTRIAAEENDLNGECKGATHFIRGWTVGAFAVQKGKRGRVSSVASMFGAGISAGSSSQSSTGVRDGDRGECQKANPTNEAPPAQCGAPLRIELRALATPAKEGGAAVRVARQQCPDGFVWTGDKCARRSTGPFECADYNPTQCRRQCEKNNAASCRKLANMYDTGMGGVNKDRRRAYEFADKACGGKDPAGCSLKAWLLVVRKGAKPSKSEYSRAVALWERNCFAGDHMGCLFMGKAYANGWGTQRSDARATNYYQRACDAGYEPGCNNLATHYYYGKGVEKDWRKARDMFRKSCAGGNHVACDNLAFMIEKGKGADPNIKEAAEYYEKGCALGNGTSCGKLGLFYLRGAKDAKYEHPKDKRKGLDYLSRACDLDNGVACYLAGKAYAKDFNVKRDLMKAASFYDKGCEQNHAGSCYAIAQMQRYGKGGKEKLSPLQLAATYEKACDKGLGRACRVLGGFYQHGEIAQDNSKAAAFYKRGCKAKYKDDASCSAYDALRFQERAKRGDLASLFGLSYRCRFRKKREACKALVTGSKTISSKCQQTKAKDACYGAGYVNYYGYGLPKNGEKAAEYYEIACKEGHQRACERAGDIHHKGRYGAKKDKLKARALYRRGNKLQEQACKDKGDMKACAALGRNLMRGRGGIKAPWKAAKLLSDACDAGLARTCVELGRYYYLGKRIGKNRNKGLKLIQRGCRDRRGRSSCADVGLNMLKGRYGFAPEKSRGLLLLGLACQSGNKFACRMKRKYGSSSYR